MTSTLFCFDLDGTLTQRELLPLIANEIGLEHEFNVLTNLTINGLISFEDSLRLRFAILKQIPVATVQQIICNVTMYENIIDFIEKNSERCFIITGNLDIWIAPLMNKIGCHYFASKTSLDNGVLNSLDYIMNKADAINSLRKAHPEHKIIALGDGINDYPMFEAADSAVCVGLTHKPAYALIAKSNYVVYQESTLCRLLKML